jgi:hypothetical protein
MNSGRKAVLHIGWPKTGTTTIQNTLFRYRNELLERYGILYPSVGPNHTIPLREMFEVETQRTSSQRIASSGNNEGWNIRAVQHFFSFDKDMETEAWRTLLLSGEGMSNMPRDAIKNLHSWLDERVDAYEIVAWLRHPVNWASSAAQQLLKSGQTLEKMSANPMLPHYKQKLTRWGDEFGYDKISIVEFESAAASKAGIVGNMLMKLGLDEDFAMSVANSVQRQNESMSLEAALILSSLNRQRPLFVKGKLGRLRTGRELRCLNGIPGQKFVMGAEMAEKVRIASRPDVEWLNNKFGLSLYMDMLTEANAGNESVANVTLKASTVDHLAILLSDLLNKEYAQVMLTKAQAALKRNNPERALKFSREAFRACPEDAAVRACIREVKRISGWGKSQPIKRPTVKVHGSPLN